MAILNRVLNARRTRSLRLMSRPAALGFVMALANGLAASAPQQPIGEYAVKAAFLYNFVKFVEWPSDTFKKPYDPFSICILGEDPFGRSLDDIVAGKSIEGRPLAVRRLLSVTQLAGCQVLFVSSATNKRFLSVLSTITIPGVLTVGDSDAASDAGVVINFKLDGGKVHFDIDLEAAEREKLRISSRLLSLAHVVGSSRRK